MPNLSRVKRRESIYSDMMEPLGFARVSSDLIVHAVMKVASSDELRLSRPCLGLERALAEGESDLFSSICGKEVPSQNLSLVKQGDIL